ncbi:MAG: hypothetical protein ACE5R4_09375 [Armatimonadota bacterium]
MTRYVLLGALSVLLAACGCPRPPAQPPPVAPEPASSVVAVEEEAQPAAEEPPEEVKIETLEAAGYTVTWEHPAWPGTCELKITRDGRLVRQFAFEGWVSAEVLEPGGGLPPHLVLDYFSGGAHCCSTLYIYSLGRRLRHLGTFDGGHAGSFEAKDVNGDGLKDMVSGDDSFAYFHCAYVSSPWLPYVLVYRNARYVDGTSECRWLLRQQMAESKQALLKPPGETLEWDYALPTDPERQAAIVEYYCLGKLLGEGDEAQKWLEENLDPIHHKWFLDHRAVMDGKLAARPTKLTYQEPPG